MRKFGPDRQKSSSCLCFGAGKLVDGIVVDEWQIVELDGKMIAKSPFSCSPFLGCSNDNVCISSSLICKGSGI